MLIRDDFERLQAKSPEGGSARRRNILDKTHAWYDNFHFDNYVV